MKASYLQQLARWWVGGYIRPLAHNTIIFLATNGSRSVLYIGCTTKISLILPQASCGPLPRVSSLARLASADIISCETPFENRRSRNFCAVRGAKKRAANMDETTLNQHQACIVERVLQAPRVRCYHVVSPAFNISKHIHTTN
jgi:hypothetical protein